MTKHARSPILHCLLGAALLCAGVGCGSTAIPGPLTATAFMMHRSAQKVQRDYHLSPVEAEKAVIEAFDELGWEYRYSTNVEDTYTIYGRTPKREHIVIDIRPKRNRFEEVQIAVLAKTNGSIDTSILFHEKISGGGPRTDTRADGSIVYRTRTQ